MRLKLILAIAAVAAFVIIFLYITTPTYMKVLNHVQELMKRTGNISLEYDVTYSSLIKGVSNEGKGKAYFTVNGSTKAWNNSVPYDSIILKLRPDKVAEVMKLSSVSSLEYVQGSCYLLNAFITEGVQSTLFNYTYIRIICCFNKTSGYPVSYSILIEGEDEGAMASYRQAFKPKTFNNSLPENVTQ